MFFIYVRINKGKVRRISSITKMGRASFQQIIGLSTNRVRMSTFHRGNGAYFCSIIDERIHRYYEKLVLPVLLVAGSFFVSCTSSVFTPTPSANPWDDNYLSVAKMEDYRQWGTYNVHDPSCRKLGDYYYMYSTDAIFGENRKEARERRAVGIYPDAPF